jgi:hypothetical protein
MLSTACTGSRVMKNHVISAVMPFDMETILS